MLRIFPNPLDASEVIERSYTCLLAEWLAIREKYPTARLYKDVICVQNDVTPKTREQAWALREANGLYQVVCHAQAPAVMGIVAAVLAVATAVYTYLNMPEMPKEASVSGSPNNSLAQRQNKHRIGGRVPDNYGKIKSLPDLISPVYRYYRNNVQVEECLLCLGTGFYDIKPSNIKEGETPINTIEGASISIYEPNQSLLSDTPQIKIGETFGKVPLVTKQVSSIDGKQVLLSPNSNKLSVSGVSVSANSISFANAYKASFKQTWDGKKEQFVITPFSKKAKPTEYFNTGEQIIIRNMTFGAVADIALSGNTDVDTAGILTIASKIDIPLVNNFKKIRISSLLVNDTNNGQLDLAGEYAVKSIEKSGSTGAWFYTVTLADGFFDVNSNYLLLTDGAVSVISAVLTDNDSNIDLNGTYTIAEITENKITLINPASINSDWDRLGELTQQQLTDFSKKMIGIAGTADNYVGWYYAGSKDSIGMLLNFIAQNGLYEGDDGKEVALEIQYQMVVDGQPTGQIYKHGEVMKGKGNNRNSIGLTIDKKLPYPGQFRFRVKRSNDNGDSQNLIDDVTFESAYSYYESTRTVYPLDTVIRLRRLAIGSGTNASELNIIAHRKLETPNGFMATSNFADIVYAMATAPYIGRMLPNEVDISALRSVSSQIAEYFGTPQATEFNYTFDDTNASYQEMVSIVADAVFSTARRENGKHYFVFEKATPNSLILFNHRNMKPNSLTVSESFTVKDGHDGVELKWRNANDNYAEALIKLPNDLCTNYKTIETQGVTNHAQAWFIANRAWNKLKYGRKAIEFTAYGEADLVTRLDRIAVVDSTIPMLCAGEIEWQENTVLTLDYPLPDTTLTDLTIHLQLKNGVVDVIDIDKIIDDYTVQLKRIPMQPLVTAGVVSTTFAITQANRSGFDSYLVEEKNANSTFETTISATKYDARYYQNDSDYLTNSIP